MGARGPVPTGAPAVNFSSGVPTPAKWLDDVARKEYRRLVNQFAAQPGLLQQVDLGILEVYAYNFAQQRALAEQIAAEGTTLKTANGYLQPNPKCALLATAQKMMLAAMAKLGLSPADRARSAMKAAPGRQPSALTGFVGDLEFKYDSQDEK